MAFMGDQSIPSEEAALTQQTIIAAQQGNFQRCLSLQADLNAMRLRRGQPAHELPEEYWRLLHELITRMGQMQPEQIEQISNRMNEMLVAAGVEFGATQQEMEFPPEYEELQRQAQAAAEREDWAEFRRLIDESQTFLNRSGIVNVNFIQ